MTPLAHATGFRRLALGATLFAQIVFATPPVPETLPLEAVVPGMEGEVWTVFQGVKPEPFKVKVTGLVRNALGPGKSMLLCELIDPRVQNMGAAAGMSGSPLYIDGKLAGALSYQVQQFETVRHAGFTPAADLLEVAALETRLAQVPAQNGFAALQPVFAFGGLSPSVAGLVAPVFETLGLRLPAADGATFAGHQEVSAEAGAGPLPAPKRSLQPGSLVAAAVCTGDLTLGATGTVSWVEGQTLVAFGHPMLGLGAVELPLCEAEVVTILPSSFRSFKLANIGPVIGTLTQDRLSGVRAELGRRPDTLPVSLCFQNLEGGERSLSLQVFRHPTLTPMLVATALLQGISGANDTGFSEGFSLEGTVVYKDGRKLALEALYPGSQALLLTLRDFAQQLGLLLNNPYQPLFPGKVELKIRALARNPITVVEQFQVSRNRLSPGETLSVGLSWRPYGVQVERARFAIPIDPLWAGKDLEVVLLSGRALDEVTGRSRLLFANQLRSREAFLEALSRRRREDGLYLAVIEKTSRFFDQRDSTLEFPNSLERIARTSDEARFQRTETFEVLFETHLLPGNLSPTLLRRSLQVTD